MCQDVAANGGPERYRACAADQRAVRLLRRPKPAKLARDLPTPSTTKSMPTVGTSCGQNSQICMASALIGGKPKLVQNGGSRALW